MTQIHRSTSWRPTGAALGLVVDDVDAAANQSAEVILALKRALLDHHVLIFKRQDLSESQFKAFATYFGSIFQPPRDVPVLASAADGATPEVVLIANVDDGYTGTGELAPHSDHHWAPIPSAGSLLYALEVPAEGGDTVFYNSHLAYETLEDGLKEEIARLQLITYNPFVRAAGEARSLYRLEEKPLISPVFPHPLVRTHPDSGKKVLYLDATTEVEVVGYSRSRGAELIARLREHLVQERFQYRHRWTPGDIVYWDNQATLHARIAFDPAQRRVMKRVSLSGSRPF